MKLHEHPEQKAIDAKLSELFNKYVPCSGAAETVGGEIIRAINRIGYRFYNDGDKCLEGYGRESVNPACRYLMQGRGFKLNIWGNYYNDAEYNYQMYEDFKHILQYLDEHPELFETKNEKDMWEYKDSWEDMAYSDEDWEEDEDEDDWDN